MATTEGSEGHYLPLQAQSMRYFPDALRLSIRIPPFIATRGTRGNEAGGDCDKSKIEPVW